MTEQAPLQWYYAKDGERIGPVKESELRQLIADGTLQPGDHVWNETMGEQWALVSDRGPFSCPRLVPDADRVAELERASVNVIL